MAETKSRVDTEVLDDLLREVDIESLNYSLKKPLKTRGAFSTEDALRKVLYLAIMQASKKWTMPIRD